MNKIYISTETDRLAVASVLIKNKYTVRQGSERRGNTKSYDYFLEYEPNPGQSRDSTGKGVAQDGD